MLKLNSHLNKGKKQLIGGFKLPYSLNGPVFMQPKWVDEKETLMVESLIGQLFDKYLRKTEKRNVLDFSHNEKDDHKNPDLFVHIDGKVFGAQVTQFVLREYLIRFNQAKNICEKISGFISDIYTPPIKINIQISTPWDCDKVPKAPIKKYKKLSKLIAKSISENVDKLTTKSEYLNFYLNNTEFDDIADNYNLYPVPNSHKSNFFGSNNIYIDYGFDDILIFEEDIKETVDKVYNDKNNGNSEILLIWGDQRQFMNSEINIVKALERKFVNTSFEMVYFITFANYLNIKDRTIYVNRIV